LIETNIYGLTDIKKITLSRIVLIYSIRYK